MARVTTIDRRSALRAGAGLAAVGALAGCSATRTAVARPSASPSKSPQAPAPRAFPRYPVQIGHGPRGQPRVALTFHGQGDPATARALLDAAEKAGARVTVLAVGNWLDAHPELAGRVLDGGHDLGNHTQRHLDINALPEAEAYAEISRCAERLRRLTGSIGTWFRPSRAARASPLVERLARRVGYPHVLAYDVDSLDFTSPGAPAVTRKITSEIRNGSVVSLHFGYTDTVAALPAVLEELDHRGLRAVTTTELLS
ncbi:polysaccharide deacetylase family protein [Streptomyces sp. HC44]|uniref:Polysaccharide deacetylase family protein n=1 Tax=Streptomyces scabichelini TaxID=2711217 RepID=A0A6G4V0S3_9ACTN|nr:polysaccharide deacetylase family protein [Streptomyces scabichelini]NGO07648.1 polysaccharide deacetylase family protein [Streptomyces scabichelini]